MQVLLDLNYQGKISILTKSTIVARDIDLLKKFKNLEVGLTVTSTGDPISQYFETNAPPHQSRLNTLKYLADAGITTYAFIGPLLPHFVCEKDKLRQLLYSIKH